MKLWAVYTQFDPTYEYEPNLESLWTTKELARQSAEKQYPKVHDYIWIEEVNVDSEFMSEENSQIEAIKKPGG